MTRPRTCHYFVDEAGDGTLFNRRKQTVVGREDVDDTRENEYGAYYTKRNPLTLEECKKIEPGI